MELSLGVTLAVLGAALLHAVWNAMIKASGDKLLDTALVCFGGIAVTAPLIAVFPPPAPASWPYLAVSVTVHVGYFFSIVGAYRAGDLSRGYPIMRGVAPVLVALAAHFWLGEAVTPAMWFGIALICGGVLSLAVVGNRAGGAPHSRAATGWALANAAIIAVYTLADGRGVRLSGSPEGYVVWMFVLDFLPFALIVLAMRRGAMVEYLAREWKRALVGGVCAVGSYGIAVWAMARAPVAAVAALRECSVVFAALIGAWLLKEGQLRPRLAGAAVVLAGIVAIKA
jgi:drug/metabolite transporter (DMT)-like permease